MSAHIPKLMGILNCTPDSFYPDSRFNQDINYKIYSNADYIDIGFESSRPGAKPLSFKDEEKRLHQFINSGYNFTKPISIDTYKPEIADIALRNGFNIINDIKAGTNNGKMFEVAAKYKCPIIIMHMKGNPLIMQNNPQYSNIMDELLYFFDEKISFAKNLGLNNKQLILDPGLGFGKTVAHNDFIINNINKLKQFKLPILIGLSRKSFLSFKNDLPGDRLPASLGVSVLALINGVDIIRTHDIESTYKMINVVHRVLNSNLN